MLQSPPCKRIRYSAASNARLPTQLSNQVESTATFSSKHSNGGIAEKSAELSKLCTQSQQIDLDAIFSPRKPIPKNGHFITRLADIAADSDCATCRFYSVVEDRTPGSTTYRLPHLNLSNYIVFPIKTGRSSITNIRCINCLARPR
jgi:hypothetical protein